MYRMSTNPAMYITKLASVNKNSIRV